MIEPNEFYEQNEIPGTGQKNKIWNIIEQSLQKEKNIMFTGFHRSSFAFGVVTAVLIFFAALGITSVFEKVNQKDEPELVTLNETYSATLDKLESFVTLKKTEYHVTNIDEVLLDKKENLDGINNEITQIKNAVYGHDISFLKQLKLLELYRMKLKLIEEIIIMGE